MQMQANKKNRTAIRPMVVPLAVPGKFIESFLPDIFSDYFFNARIHNKFSNLISEEKFYALTYTTIIMGPCQANIA